MRRFVKPVLVILGGLALGVSTAVGVLLYRFDNAWVQYGPWRTNPAIGRPDAGIYTRAEVAVGGVLALPTSEVVYLVAEHDSRDRALSAACTYRVTGGPLPAGWWSLTVYGADRFLIPNAEGRYSYTSTEIGGGKSWTVTVTRHESPGYWLPAGAKDQSLILVLRLYRAGNHWARRLGGGAAPRIVQEACP